MAQIDKNTVSSKNQLKNDEYIKFYGDGDALKVLFVGNSITRHGIKEDIGWFSDYGMAATKEENDYVHIVMNEINMKHTASYCVCQAAIWEVNYKNPKETVPFFSKARDFEADVIIMRIVENVSIKDFDSEVFEKEYVNLINYLDKKKKAKIIVTNSFWKHPADKSIKVISEKNIYDFVSLNDLGELDEMKALGLFEHEGVANHPGDLGMYHIAKRILKKLM